MLQCAAVCTYRLLPWLHRSLTHAIHPDAPPPSWAHTRCPTCWASTLCSTHSSATRNTPQRCSLLLVEVLTALWEAAAQPAPRAAAHYQAACGRGGVSRCMCSPPRAAAGNAAAFVELPQLGAHSNPLHEAPYQQLHDACRLLLAPLHAGTLQPLTAAPAPLVLHSRPAHLAPAPM